MFHISFVFAKAKQLVAAYLACLALFSVGVMHEHADTLPISAPSLAHLFRATLAKEECIYA